MARISPARRSRPKFNVFLCWAGEPAKPVAAAFREWLPTVMWNAKPFFSEEDIEKGTSWDNEIHDSLSGSATGVVFVTPWNQASPWLNYESGALARNLGGRGRVHTVLLGGVRPSDITSPLHRFQHTVPNKFDFLKLVDSIGKAIKTQMPFKTQQSTFEDLWHKMESKLSVEPPAGTPVEHRNPEDLLDEILQVIRRLQETTTFASMAYPSYWDFLQAQWKNAPQKEIERALVDNRRASKLWVQQQTPDRGSRKKPAI